MSADGVGKWVAGVATVALVGTLVVLGWTHRSDFTAAEVGARAPEVRLVSLTGDTLALSDYRGQVVLLNFWATWCPPCVRELPAMERAYDALRDRGFTVLAVAVDAMPASDGQGPGANVRQFVDRFDLSFPILLDRTGDTEMEYGVTGLPTSYVIGPDGVIESRVIGAREWDSAEYTQRFLELMEE